MNSNVDTLFIINFYLVQGLSCCEHFVFYIVKIISEITAETVVIIVKRIVNVKYCRVRIHYRHNISRRTEKKLVVIYHLMLSSQPISLIFCVLARKIFGTFPYTIWFSSIFVKCGILSGL